MQRIGYQDGLKLYLEDGSWVLFRASGTEPLLRVYLETHSPEQATQITQALQQQLVAMQSRIV
ncbi:hypothetical protein [Neosynechococcus sphagnicola]|uniref:hypothetical protein n=1 Tax=Neosynechococcus sphagnicola TaxID=1501145 RepID=UPI001EF9F449|nr:hypothetical protein [Neosynechococcus sphagnicola]